MCLGRIIRITGGEHLSLIRPSRLTIFFVSGDVLGLLVQGAGAIVMPLGTLQDYRIGSRIVIGGLSILVVYFGLFILFALTFNYRLDQHPTSRSLHTSLNWRADLRALFISSALIFIRSVFRLVEYSQGNDGWLMKREWTLYIFDAILMWVVLVIFNIWHPSHVEALRKGGKYVSKGVRIIEIKMEDINYG
jgi:RTA1 like protein